jgi:hypothetical protein
LALDHVTVTEPGAVALVGLTLIEADTDAGTGRSHAACDGQRGEVTKGSNAPF